MSDYLVQSKPDVLISVEVQAILENIIPGGMGDIFPDIIRPIPRRYNPPLIVNLFPALLLAP
jgi:hypothetical protein